MRPVDPIVDVIMIRALRHHWHELIEPRRILGDIEGIVDYLVREYDSLWRGKVTEQELKLALRTEFRAKLLF